MKTVRKVTTRLMRLSWSHPVLLHRLAERKASAMICNALSDILIN